MVEHGGVATGGEDLDAEIEIDANSATKKDHESSTEEEPVIEPAPEASKPREAKPRTRNTYKL